MLVERNHDTTKWPKMDVTNVRSMEILKKLGVEDGIRSVGGCHRKLK
jgi:FAD-dependent monooxygenase